MRTAAKICNIVIFVLVLTLFVRAYVRFRTTYVMPHTDKVVVVANPVRPLPKLDFGRQKFRQAPSYSMIQDAALPFLIVAAAVGGSIVFLLRALKSLLLTYTLDISSSSYALLPLLSPQTTNNSLIFYRRPPPVD